MGANTRFWEVIHISGDRYALRHAGDRTAYDIAASLSGHAVINGQRNWGYSLSEMNPGDRLDFKLKRAMGADQDPPVIHVSWRVVDGDDAVHESADYPVPR